MNHSLQESKQHTHTHVCAEAAHKYLGNQKNLLSLVARLAAPLSAKRGYQGCAQSVKGLTTPGWGTMLRQRGWCVFIARARTGEGGERERERRGGREMNNRHVTQMI